MRSFIATCVAAILGSGIAQAGSSAAVGVDNRIRIEVAVTANLVADDTAYTQGKVGYYVFVASALPSGLIEAGAIEKAAACTGLRPRFGRTLPTVSGFKRSAYAVYYGPYRTRQEANHVCVAVGDCVTDAYVRGGSIQRF